MSLTIEPQALPLRISDNGTVYIGQTRVMLELVVYQFQLGETPEQIIQNFDVLKLADVYAVIAYYLTHKAEVEAYMAEQKRRGEEVRRMIEEKQPDMLNLHKRLTERKRQMEMEAEKAQLAQEQQQS